jgi:hypothetical protein
MQQMYQEWGVMILVVQCFYDLPMLQKCGLESLGTGLCEQRDT